ncbi:Zinc finger CCCH domain-containing protein 38 [Spatholobus suberectus]|nr:Zinc finger CCCH domain-containing protein 38 [Spatholobus suberectus]
MSGSGRKTSSKWDSRDESEFSSYSSSKWSYLERNDKLKPRMGFSCKEPFSGGRGSNTDDFTNKDYRVLDATDAWDTDGSYSMTMSPGPEDCKNKYSQSPKDGCSRSVRSNRSRSRSWSPPHGFRWDSGVNDRYRMRAGGLTQPCRDFAAGKCRRGSQCHFLHHDSQNYDDSWESRHRQAGTPRYSAPHESGESGDYSRTSGRSNETCINYAKGRCRMGASCKYVHNNNSDQFSKVSVDESTREREIDRRRTESSFEQGGRHATNHNGDIPCKFFAFGNCRNGKHCRFSHDRQACGSPNRRFRDDRSRSSQGGDQALDRPKLSDEFSPNGRLRDDRWGLDGSMADVDKVWDGSKQNDLVVVSDIAKLVEDKRNGIMGAPEPVFTAWPISDGWDHSLDKKRVHGESPFSSDMKEASWAAKNDSANVHTSQSVGTDIWPGNEKMSPDWNYGVGPSTHIKEEHGQSKQQVAPGQVFHQNVNALHSSSCHAVGQSQVAASIVPPRVRTIEGMQNQEVSAEKKYIVEPNIMDVNLSQVGSRNPPTQNLVSKEQLAQLTSLSASLAHIIGTGRQLPQLYATSISLDAKDTPFLSKTEGSGNPVSITFIKPDPAVGFQKQCDPICNSREPKNASANEVLPTFSPSKIIPKDTVEIPSLLSKLGKEFDDSKSAFLEEQFVQIEHSVQLQKGENVEVNKEDKVVAEEKQSSPCENKITEEYGPLENLDQNSGPDEAKKIKDVKGIRAFKFSLVEFVKELLKPTWKDGKITKEDYKAIVKKVTDKVTGTMQRVHIPQTQEKIDRYLSLSKPKLNKLIQAYVEKVQKS